MDSKMEQGGSWSLKLSQVMTVISGDPGKAGRGQLDVCRIHPEITHSFICLLNKAKNKDRKITMS